MMTTYTPYYDNVLYKKNYITYPGSISIKPFRGVALTDLFSTVCTYFECEEKMILSKSRKTELVQVRQLFCFFARKYLKYGLVSIGRQTGNDHATVLNSINRVKSLLFTDKKYKAMVNDLETYILLKYNKS